MYFIMTKLTTEHTLFEINVTFIMYKVTTIDHTYVTINKKLYCIVQFHQILLS